GPPPRSRARGADTQLYIVDAAGEAVPPGAAGELLIGGAGLARGYLDRPALTAERWVPDPFGGCGERLYRTGDRVRQRADGVIDFVGRMDFQVKIRGFRIEPGEVRAALLEHPAVADAQVLVLGDGSDEKRLVACIVGDQQELGDYLAGRLPRYMVPSAWVFCDAFPITPNGKVDRIELGHRAAIAVAQEVDRDGTADRPRSPREEMLVALWGEILGHHRVGVHDSFFDLGGHSLLATRLVARLRARFGVEVPLSQLFAAPTIADLASFLDQASGGAAEGPRREPVVGPVELSPAQRRLWFLDRLDPESSAYHMPSEFEVRGEFDGAVWAVACRRLVERHQVLRCAISEAGSGRPLQIPATVAAGIDLSALPPTRRRAEADRLTAAECFRPFRLAAGEVCRFRWLRLEAQRHRLLWVFHHIASDGWSLGVVDAELNRLYGALRGGEKADLAPLPLQYSDYARWQNRRLDETTVEKLLQRPLARLADAPTLELPLDRPRPAQRSPRGASLRFALPGTAVAALEAYGRSRGETLFVTLATAYFAFLGRWTGQSDIVLGTPVAGRDHPDLEGLVGFFVNTLVLRLEDTRRGSYEELLGRLRVIFLEAYDHRELPFETLVEELSPERDPSLTPLIQAVFSLQPPAPAPVLGETVVRRREIPSRHAKFDLTCALDGDGRGTLEYAADLFDRTTIERLASQLGRWIEALAAAPTVPLAELDLLSSGERHQLLREWAVELPAVAEGTVLALFAEQARERPDGLAISAAEGSLSYGELQHRAAIGARALVAGGLRRGEVVALVMPRCPQLIEAALAVLMAGGAYLPIAPDLPAERIAWMIADSGARRRFTVAAAGAEGLEIGVESWPPAPAEGAVRLPDVTPDDLAYVIYTSGSTGRPKGTLLAQRGLHGLVRWHHRKFAPRPGERSSLVAGVSFDASVWETWSALCHGLTLVIPPSISLERLLPWIERERLDTVFLPTPVAEAAMAQAGWRPQFLRYLFVGGDRLHRSAPADADYRLANLYGPTEATVITVASQVESAERGLPPIGRPLDGVTVRVLDGAGNAVPVGVSGELLLGGDALAWGYLGRPGLTAERFVPDPLGDPGARLYRTGDLARWRADGELECLGRVDRQVKVRGFRLELGEVEAALAEHPAVHEVVALVLSSPQRLVAFVCGDDIPDLAPWLRDRLPAPAVPQPVVVLPELPRTPNGKVDRRALAARALPIESGTGRRVRTPTEEILAGFWCELLEREEVAADADFFALGGHSLLAARLAARLEATFGRPVSLARFFAAPTLEALAREIDAGGGATVPPAISPVDRSRPLALSFAQRRLWFLDRLEPGSPAYNVPLALRLEGDLDVAALRATLGAIVARHESLRTVFQTHDGEPYQRVRPSAPPPLPGIDLQALPPERRWPEAHRWASLEARVPFDLERGPLCRFTLLHLESGLGLLLFTHHHAISDGWSTGIFLRELGLFYGAARRGESSPLAPLTVQYADFAAWQRGWLMGDELERQVDFWRHSLADTERLELATDRPRPAVRSTLGAVHRFPVAEDVNAAIAALGQRLGATPFMILLAVFEVLLRRRTGQRRLSVGTPVAGRRRPETEPMIGFFVNTLALRADVSGEPTFSDLVGRVRQHVLDAFAHQDVPFEKLVEELSPQRDLAHTPLFQVMFILQNLDLGEMDWPGVEVTPVPLDLTTSKFDLTLALHQPDGGLAGHWAYRRDLFDETTIRRLAGQYVQLLTAAVADPEGAISALPLLSPGERHQLRREWNDAGPDYAVDDDPWAMVRAVAERWPDRVALVDPEGQVSYGALVTAADRLARRLRARGVAMEEPVAVYLERRADMVVALLAVLAAGAAYLPLDPSYPLARLEHMIADSRVRFGLRREPGPEVPPGALDWLSVTPSVPDQVALPAPAEADPAAAAYIIYTSGSTGRPKGVVISRRSLARRLSYARAHDFSAQDTFLQKTSISFDVSVLEIFGPLVAGGRVLLAKAGGEQDPSYLMDAIARHRVTQASFPPTLLEVLRDEPDFARLDALHTLITGGETVPPDLPGKVLERLPRVAVLNRYGPTETTVSVSSWRCSPQPSSASLPIGRPTARARFHLLDRAGREVPVGQPGEVHLGGEGVARGYLSRPALTAQAFVPDPWGPPGARLYRSGDLARWRADGVLEFVGRADRQVKVRGFRIEPGEIEAVLRRSAAVREAAVVDLPDGASRRLVAFWVPDAASPAAAADLEAEVRRELPEHMVPSAFVALDALPLSPTGKIDRQALADLELPAAPGGERVAPRSRLEERLLKLWEECLKTSPLGITDSFFALGGHSLLAVRLARRIEEQLGTRIALATLFQNPTVGELALVLEGRAETSGQLVTLRAAGSDSPSAGHPSAGRPSPWYWVHPVGGSIACYLPLARRLEAPMGAFQAPGIEVGERPRERVEELAELYVEELVNRRPEGPILLGGWSFGGVVAYEMARRLAERGRTPERLVLIDAQVPTTRRPLREVSLWKAFLLDLGVESRAGERPGDLDALAARASGLPGGDELARLYRVFRAHAQALRRYRGGPYTGSTLLVLPAGQGKPAPWRRWIGSALDELVLPGDHYSILTADGLVPALARRPPALDRPRR
ncbi:MAG: amino acid adenylation domain-containing protein, partial [Acidobacteriota bacterium]